MRSLLGGIALAIIFGATVLFLLVLVGPQSANAAMCPDGSYVSGSTCTLCPNGSYVGGGRCVLQPDGTYTGGFSGYGGSPAPGPTFNTYPALGAKTFDYGKIMRDAEALRTQRLQNQLLQQQLQQQRWQLQQQLPSQPIRAAPSLDQLRASGAVGERYDGYAEALQSSAAGMVQQVNAKRRQIYQQTANKEGASVDRIGRVYAQHIFAKAPPGTKFLQGNGSWIAK